MKKEMLLAIVIGLSLGLLLTYGFYRARLAMTRPRNQANIVNSTPQPSPVASTDLVLISPLDEVVQSERTTQITGTTRPDNFVVIFVNDEEQITQGDSSGNFSVEATLETGSNVIIVQAIDEDGATTTLERTVIVATVSSATPDASESASPSPTASPAL
jgi:hypothetical protein